MGFVPGMQSSAYRPNEFLRKLLRLRNSWLSFRGMMPLALSARVEMGLKRLRSRGLLILTGTMIRLFELTGAGTRAASATVSALFPVLVKPLP